jgi:hypothetical protein
MYAKGSQTRYCHKGHDKNLVGRIKQGSCKICVKNKNMKSKYHIDLTQYNELFAKQNGLCAGCYRHPTQLKRNLFIDHDHKTGKVRGLLCITCNTTLGKLLDDATILRRLADYLER